MAFVRNLARIIVVALKSNPRVLHALQQQQRIEEACLKAHGSSNQRVCVEQFHGARLCSKCGLLSTNLVQCQQCNRTRLCEQCAGPRRVCVRGCCTVFEACCPEVCVQTCATLGCVARTCWRSLFACCLTCQDPMCTDHRRYCSMCGAGCVCVTCHEQHEGMCKRCKERDLKRARVDANQDGEDGMDGAQWFELQ